MDGIFFSLQYFIPHELLNSARSVLFLLVLAALLYVGFARFATTPDRLSFAAVTISIAAFGILPLLQDCSRARRIVPRRSVGLSRASGHGIDSYQPVANTSASVD